MIAVARDPKMPAEGVNALTRHPKMPADRINALARHPKTSADRVNAPARHPKTSADRVNALARHPKTSADRVNALARHPKTSADRKNALARHPKTSAGRNHALARHPKTSCATMSAMTERKGRARDLDSICFGLVVKRLRISRGMQVQQLAAATGLSRAHVGVIERGGNSPNLRTFLTLSHALGVDPMEVLREFLQTRAQVGTQA
jgi:DNA-binding XRE family transcriptional regulator